MEENLNLSNDFPLPNFADWQKQVEAELKGESFEKKLVTKTYDGINLQPIYTQEDIQNLPFLENYPGFENFIRGNKASGYHASPWEIAQEYSYALPEEINEALKYDLQRGLNSINISLDLPTQLGKDADQSKIGEVGRGGLSISGIRKMQVLFDDINLTEYPVHIHGGFSALPFTLLFASYTRELRLSLMNIRGSITSDPYEFLLRYGFLPISLNKIFDEIKIATQLMIRSSSPLRTVGVSGVAFSNAGATAVQELAFTFATAVEYLNELLSRGLDITDVVPRFKFTFGIGSFFFMEIAKLRAARVLWHNIIKAYGLKEEDYKIYIHGKTIEYNKTISDPYVNMLRGTTETFSAVLSGADAITNNPFNNLFKQPDNFSRRIARNTQIILRDESHLDFVIDPAAGSFFIEKLTNDICQEAWKLFQKIVDSGGMLENIKSGFVQNEIKKVADSRKSDYAKRKSVLVGTNMYVNPKEELQEIEAPNYEEIYNKRVAYIQKYRVSGDDKKHQSILEKLQQIADSKSYDIVEIAIEAYIDGAAIGEISSSLRSNINEEIKIEPLDFTRAAEPFELLKRETEKIKSVRGSKPKVFLATMGTLKQYKARADFSRGFFETGGFDIIYPSAGFNSADDAVNAAINSNADIITICSTDDTYPELVPQITKAIKENDKNKIVVLAGYPKDQIEQHKASGVDEFIYLGGNVQSILLSLMNKITNSF